MSEPEKFKVNVYIDGFNFYYGLKAKQWRKFYWLDIVAFYELFMKENQVLNKVYYCTAKPTDIGKKNRQGAFFKANSLNPKFELVFGKFLEKDVCYDGQWYKTFEEKQTDVNIAVKLLRGVFLSECDSSIIVSGDSDLAPAIKLANEIDPSHKIFVHFPPERGSITLEKCSHAIIHLHRYEARFNKCLLPDEVQMPNGSNLTKPDHWI